jgi:hypothetical protein
MLDLPSSFQPCLQLLLTAKSKDLLGGEAAGEVVKLDPAYSANVGDGATVKPPMHDSGHHIDQIAVQRYEAAACSRMAAAVVGGADHKHSPVAKG